MVNLQVANFIGASPVVATLVPGRAVASALLTEIHLVNIREWYSVPYTSVCVSVSEALPFYIYRCISCIYVRWPGGGQQESGRTAQVRSSCELFED